MVIVCCRDCDSGTVIPLFLKVVAPPATNLIRLRREYQLEGLDSVLIPKLICSRQLSL
jgi:hypothetical protein